MNAIQFLEPGLVEIPYPATQLLSKFEEPWTGTHVTLLVDNDD